MKFGQNQTRSEKAKMVEKRLGKTTGASKGAANAPKAEKKVRPMGGLNPHGVKLNITKQTWAGKR